MHNNYDLYYNEETLIIVSVLWTFDCNILVNDNDYDNYNATILMIS